MGHVFLHIMEGPAPIRTPLDSQLDLATGHGASAAPLRVGEINARILLAPGDLAVKDKKKNRDCYGKTQVGRTKMYTFVGNFSVIVRVSVFTNEEPFSSKFLIW